MNIENYTHETEFHNGYDRSVYLVSPEKHKMNIRDNFPEIVYGIVEVGTDTIVIPKQSATIHSVDNMESILFQHYEHEVQIPSLIATMPLSFSSRIQKLDAGSDEDRGLSPFSFYGKFSEVDVIDSEVVYSTFAVQPLYIEKTETEYKFYFSDNIILEDLISEYTFNGNELKMEIIECMPLLLDDIIEIISEEGSLNTIIKTKLRFGADRVFYYKNHSWTGKLIMDSYGVPIEMSEIYIDDSLNSLIHIYDDERIFSKEKNEWYVRLSNKCTAKYSAKLYCLFTQTPNEETYYVIKIDSRGSLCLDAYSEDFTMDIYHYDIRKNSYTNWEEYLLAKYCMDDYIQNIQISDDGEIREVRNKFGIEEGEYTDYKYTAELSISETEEPYVVTNKPYRLIYK